MVSSTGQQYAGIAAEVAARGFAVRRGFISREEAGALRACLLAWWEEGRLRKAGIGRGDGFQVREDIRGDYVRWLDFSVDRQFADIAGTHFEPLRLAVNREMFLGVYEFEGHVTVYPPGAFYRRHVDRFQDTAHRKLSVILYLNEADWCAEDGGELRLFAPKDGSAGHGEETIDVLPEGGTLVVFLSHEIPHEVLPARRERYSLTGWFRTR